MCYLSTMSMSIYANIPLSICNYYYNLYYAEMAAQV